MASRGRGRAVRRPAASITPPGGLQTPADADPVGEVREKTFYLLAALNLLMFHFE